MNWQKAPFPVPDISQDVQNGQRVQEAIRQGNNEAETPGAPPVEHDRLFKNLSPFWHDRLVEGTLILSMLLYYIVGNTNLGSGYIFRLNPLISLPFLLIFGVLCWYRLNFALALLPLALPYYLLQKTVYSHYAFSIAEIALAVCVVVFLLQLVFLHDRWPLTSLWRDLRDHLGPFALPILVFFLAAAFSIVIAYDRHVALRAFREEVFDPLLYLSLALVCLRTRRDVARLLLALLATAFVVALIGFAQYFVLRDLFSNLPALDLSNRVHAMYGSANSIGLLFDYTLPIGFALMLTKIRKNVILESWWFRGILLLAYVPLLFVLYQSQSRGAWLAIAAALLFVVALSIPNRRVLLVGGLVFIVVVAVIAIVFHSRVINFIVDEHTSATGVSTLTKRLYLWQVALNMIHNSPWFGYGMENWLCHYSLNTVCHTPNLYHYWGSVPGAYEALHDEPDLSHPHNIFLQVWVSMGIFGLLAFIGVIVLFCWLFVRMLTSLRTAKVRGWMTLRWMTLGVGAALLASLLQGQVDSSFLEQDLAFCFWMLVAALLLLRVLSGTPWRVHKA
ncbi:MAG TPA: O-antigen ligase family protein [Ktedonobacteraceae bacterium]|nr:O-antigen ligase family protein [Ktedonobacteraceae bacterium]